MMYSNSTDIEYVFDVMISDGFRFFKIINASGNVQMDQSNPGVSPEQAVNSLKHFLLHNRGLFTVVLRDKAKASPGSGNNNRTFYISNTQSVPISGTGTEKNIPIGSMYGNDAIGLHEKISQLQDRIVQMNIEHQEKLLSKERELMNLQMQMKSQSEQDTILGLGAGILKDMFSGGGQNVGLQGIGDEPLEDVAVKTSSEFSPEITSAVKRLAKADPDLGQNLTSLADLAEKNKTMYNQGVAMIKGFV
jgi:TolA-binding protein